MKLFCRMCQKLTEHNDFSFEEINRWKCSLCGEYRPSVLQSPAQQTEEEIAQEIAEQYSQWFPTGRIYEELKSDIRKALSKGFSEEDMIACWYASIWCNVKPNTSFKEWLTDFKEKRGK